MNAESAGQDPEISHRPFVRLPPFAESETDQRQIEGYNEEEEYPQHNPYLFARERYNFSNRNLSATGIATNSGRNKRKNFNPRYTSSTSPMGKSSEENDGNSNVMSAATSNEHLNTTRDDLHYRLRENQLMSRSSKSPSSPSGSSSRPVSLNNAADSGAASAAGDGGGSVPQTELPPWVQMFNHYDQLVKVAGLAQYQIPSGSGFHETGSSGIPTQTDWVRKFGSSQSTVTAIRDLLKAYQGRGVRETQQDGNGIVNLSAETEPPTPPTTPHTCNALRSINIPNGSGGHHSEPPASSSHQSSLRNSPIKEEGILQPTPEHPPPVDSVDTTSYPKNLCTDKCESPASESLPQNYHQWSNDPATGEYSHEKWKKKESSGDEDDDRMTKTEIERFNSYHDDSSDCCGGGDQQQTSGRSSSQHLRQWSTDDFQKIPEAYDKRRIKSECDDTDTTVGDADNNLYDDDDYPQSPNDFPDSANDDEDDDDSYSLNLFCDDEQSTATEDQMRTNYSSECDRNAIESADVDESRSLVAEKDGSCSNSSSKISVRNLGGFFEQSPLSLVPSKLRSGIDDKNLHSDFVQNMNKFTSYLECQNEMCRLENLREHYHCYDFPCFGKILSKKEEVIRHVKWHRKRMESLNHGFMRFSSSDDCSTTFGNNCQHNRKQTHYHCFQPNCDRVYISTSDVQMHSNFHRKDSAIHKEGFQRFRANEKCSADYCMFADQKTTHFHCRRDNCRYTFKNKADMEKHKTYHIKDLKLTRDGFKKFLKNEPCPYKECRFSKVCNHIHCARENCFYVLHSSGQLLSHKRKHERMDNEQTYCRYKMLAVKAALLGNAAAAAAVSPEISPYNLTNSLLQLRDLEISAFIPRAPSEPSLPSPKEELSNKDCVTELPSPSSLSIEFLQQMKKRHEELLKQKQQHPLSDPIATATTHPEVSMFPVIQQTSSPKHQYNMALDPTHLTPSVIQQFFTTECLTRKLDADEPINLKSDEKSHKVQKNSCPWKERLEPHLHCIIKDCETVIPNNVLDISAHIRIHGYNRDVYATTAAAAAASESLLSSGTGTSNNPMQITTIDGFFNRKRGRPPKNRFVEVYKNAQQSPQAIFTSFKLEKQIMNKDASTPSDGISSSSYIQPTSLSIDTQQKEQPADENRLMSLPSPQSQAQVTALVQTPIPSQFTTHKANEHCGVPGGGRCSLTMQHHYHCACSPDCTFFTVERDLLSVHLERQHTTASFADTISKKFKRFDRNIGLDCGIIECRLRKTRPHLHCRQCYRQISPFDLETHICGNLDQGSVTSSPTKTQPTFYSPEYRGAQQQHLQPEILADNFSIHSGKNLIRDYTRLPSVTFSTLTELRRKVSEMEPETSSLPKRTHEEEKVLVVRAAGTYFPENTNELSAKTPAPSADCMQMPVMSPNTAFCSTPYCKMKRKPHEHCEFCDQSFLDPAKSKSHRLKHFAATTKPIPAHLLSLHSTEPSEENKLTSYLQPPPSSETRPSHAPVAYDDQPQDLSLSPHTATATTLEKKMKPSRETSTAAPTAPQLASAPGHFPNLFPPELMCSISMQNFHLAQLATLYQQNPYYYQHLYPFLSNAAALTRHQQHRQAQIYRVPCNEDKPYLTTPAECPKLSAPPGIPPLPPGGISNSTAAGHFPFLSPLLMARQQTAEATVAKQTVTAASGASSGISMPMPSGAIAPLASEAGKSLKRKLTNGGDDFSAFIDALPPSTKKQMQFAAGLAAAAAAAAATGTGTTGGGGRSNTHEQHGQHFKIKDEQIPTGYLKFRFNEDCYFPKCGYRNHQSHFHCDRNDCHYSFCDKTRFVQHTARHERLDKLMGNDFRQYRANMNCGYENCPYFKNLGSANKSSHFHCLKCDFICSDTNKVVAHRRQHSKMEYIRMAGFRKVTNSEKCNSTFEATVPTNGNEVPGTIECSYSQKQTHYHCLVCDVSVLSRAQLASHKHKT